MEATPFTLKYAIDKYIDRINNQGSLTTADVHELKAHLYDATVDLQQSKLTEEEAFMIACSRLGSETVLTEEYSKVNPSVNTNKIWAYLFIGFNTLYSLPTIFFMGITLVYFGIHVYFGDGDGAKILTTLMHITFIFLMYYLVKKKNVILKFIEKQVNTNAVNITMLSFVPMLPIFFFSSKFYRLELSTYSNYPSYILQSDIAQFTYILAGISIIMAILSLVFTINNRDKFTLKILLEKPSIFFLICFGVTVEFIAASTRLFSNDGFYVSVILFGLVYFVGTFLVVRYNSVNQTTKYILFFTAFGFIVETIFGISADMERENFYGTISFVSALVIGAFAGRYVGLKYPVKRLTFSQ